MRPTNFEQTYYEVNGNRRALQDYYDKSDRTIRSWISDTIKKQRPEIENVGGEIQVKGDAVVLGDLHIPQQHDEFLAQVCAQGCRQRRNGIATLILNGDTFNLDEFSRFIKKQKDASWDNEKKEAKRIMKMLLDSFDYLVFVQGNHDERLSKLHPAFTFEDLIERFVPSEEMGRIFVTERNYCILNDGWLIVHPDEYAKTPGLKARKLAETHGMNVVAAHSHMLGKYVEMDSEKDFDYVAIDGGCCIDEGKVAYKQEKKTTHSAWSVGCVIFRDGKFDIMALREPNEIVIRKREWVMW